MPARRRILLAAGALVIVALVAGAVAVTRSDDGRRADNLAATAPPTTSAPPPDTVETTTTTTTSPPPPTAAPTSAAPAKAAARPRIVVPRPGEPVAPDDPAELAAQIVAAEDALADPATPGADLARSAHFQQVAYRKLSREPDLRAAVVSRLPARLRPVAEDNATAAAKLRALLKAPREELPDWHIVPPAPAAELLGYYREAEAETGVPWQVLAAVHLVETRMGRIRGVSEAGARGPMQFMPATWAAYGEGDIESNRDSIRAAARYLQRNGAPGDLRRALFRYNRDVRYVDAVLLYAGRMQADERAYVAYHGWQVYYVHVDGDVWLPEGWRRSAG